MCLYMHVQVVDMREVTHLKDLKALASLNLANNPIEVSLKGVGPGGVEPKTGRNSG